MNLEEGEGQCFDCSFILHPSSFILSQAMTEANAVPWWLRAWAWLTVLTCLPLVTLGAEVTTKKVGMADPVALRNPLYLFEQEEGTLRFVHLWQTGQMGVLIEHAHRLFGWLVGFECLVLAIGMGLWAQGGYR